MPSAFFLIVISKTWNGSESGKGGDVEKKNKKNCRDKRNETLGWLILEQTISNENHQVKVNEINRSGAEGVFGIAFDWNEVSIQIV